MFISNFSGKVRDDCKHLDLTQHYAQRSMRPFWYAFIQQTVFIKKSKFQRQRINWDQSLNTKKDCRSNIFFIAGKQISNNFCVGRPIIAQCAWSRPTA